MKAMKENGFISIRMFECMYRTYAFARTVKVEVPQYAAKRKCGEEIKYNQSEINVTKNKCDMRGHTGFLIYGINTTNE